MYGFAFAPRQTLSIEPEASSKRNPPVGRGARRCLSSRLIFLAKLRQTFGTQQSFQARAVGLTTGNRTRL